MIFVQPKKINFTRTIQDITAHAQFKASKPVPPVIKTRFLSIS